MSQEQNDKSAEAGMKTEVVAKGRRRQYPAEYKLRILQEVEECKGSGEVGALLRREGLYSSLVSKWREQRERGSLTGLSGHKRGPKVDPQAKEVERLQRENKRLQEKLERAELIIDVQKKSSTAAWHTSGRQQPERGVLMQSAEQLGQRIGVRAACGALSVPRSSLYHARRPRAKRSHPKISPRAFSQAEKITVRQELNSERFQDRAPREVYATLLDEGQYLCSWRSMYRILAENDEVRERRNQLRHPNYSKPELQATGPNQLWSWDITKLLGPSKWTYYYLYVILDVFSRYVVGWMIAERESATLAEELIAETRARQGIQPDQLTIHADRGSSMTSKSVAFLLADLGVTKTHSRPHVSNDNPYSEAQFTPALAGGARETLKYRPDYPSRFGCQADARAWANTFFTWYNQEHHHSGLALLTPADVHYQRAQAVLQKRQLVLRAAYQKTPQRFVKGLPVPPQLPQAVWINPPKVTAKSDQILKFRVSYHDTVGEIIMCASQKESEMDRELTAQKTLCGLGPEACR